MIKKIKTITRHLWLDADDTRSAIPPDMLKRLSQRVAATERRHSGEVRICVEAALPASYVWRLGSDTSIVALSRQRAVMMFGKLRVWDTEHNNGVLIYLMLAEHAIEIVADRGVARHVDAAEWQRIAATMSAAFKAGQIEAGLNQAIDAVDALLMQHFALAAGEVNPNELPDAPYLR